MLTNIEINFSLMVNAQLILHDMLKLPVCEITKCPNSYSNGYHLILIKLADKCDNMYGHNNLNKFHFQRIYKGSWRFSCFGRVTKE